MKKLLITGISGFWGSHLYKYFSSERQFNTYGTYNNYPIKEKNTYKLDIGIHKDINLIFNKIKPDIIIHTAAISKVNICENNKRLAYNINCEAVKVISDWCNKNNCKLIFFSTDMVYNSKDENILFKEEDKLNPTNYYAESKMMAENIIQNNIREYIILRVALSYGKSNENHKGFTDWLFDNFSQNKRINLFLNQWRTPIYIKDGIKFISKLLEKNIQEEIINFGGKEKVNRVIFGETFAEIMGFDKSLINKVRVPDNTYHSSSINSSMNIEKIKKLTGIEPNSIFFNLTQLRKEYNL